MKNITKLSVLALMALGSWTAQAQQRTALSNLLHSKKQNSTAFRGGITAFSSKGTAARPTAESFYRPVAITSFEYGLTAFEPVDSVTISWEGNRGNNLDILGDFGLYHMENFHYLFENFDFTYFDSYPLIAGPDMTQRKTYPAPFANTPDETESFYYKNDKKDSVTFASTGNYNLYRYDNNGNLTAILYYDGNVLNSYDSVIYNSSNLKTSQVSGDMANKRVDNFYYDGSNKMVAHEYLDIDVPSNTVTYKTTDTIYAVSAGADSLVSYDDLGDPSEQVVIYRTNNLIDSLHMSEVGQTSGMMMRYLRNAGNVLTGVEIWESNFKAAEVKFEYHTNGKLSAVEMHDPMVNYRETMTYDNNNNLTAYTTFSAYDAVNNAWEHVPSSDIQNNFYYELYDDTPGSVGKLAKGAVSLYPNPASGVLNIRTESGAISGITVYDAMGRVVLQQQANAIRSNEAQVNVEQLSNGNYIIRLQTDKGAGTASFVKH